MTTRFILSFLKIAATILFYFLALFTLLIIVSAITKNSREKYAADKISNNPYSFEVKGFGDGNKEQPIIYSNDSIVRYNTLNDHYIIEVSPGTKIGYYGLFMKLIYLCLGLVVLWNFRKIFKNYSVRGYWDAQRTFKGNTFRDNTWSHRQISSFLKGKRTV